MKSYCLKFLITTALSGMSVYASQNLNSPETENSCLDHFFNLLCCFKKTSSTATDVHVSVSAVTTTDNTMHAAAVKKSEILEEAEAIAKGRLAYNQLLLNEMNSTDVSILDRITYYAELEGCRLKRKTSTGWENEILSQSILHIQTDLNRYIFFIDLLSNIKTIADARQKRQETDVLYAMLQCVCKINSHYEQESGILAAQKDFFETPFLQEMAQLAGSTSISPAYKRFQDYLVFRDGQLLVGSIFSKYGDFKKTQQEIESFEKKFVLETSKINETSREQIRLMMADYKRLINEENSMATLYNSKVSGFYPDFENLSVGVKFISVAAEPLYGIMSKMLNNNVKFKKMIPIYDDIFAQIKAKEDEKRAQKEFEKQLKNEKDAQRKAATEQRRAEHTQKFNEEQALLKAQYDERVARRHAAAAEEGILKEESRQREKERIETSSSSHSAASASSSSAVAGGAPSHTRTAQKIKTKGVPAPAPVIVETELPIAPVIRTIPEHVRNFVTYVMDEDFDTVKDRFEREMGATITQTKGNKWVFSFRSPVNDELLRFYADNPHGAQNEKFRTAWRALMQDALERGQMKVR